jgi:hypothetical protein
MSIIVLVGAVALMHIVVGCFQVAALHVPNSRNVMVTRRHRLWKGLVLWKSESRKDLSVDRCDFVLLSRPSIYNKSRTECQW